MSAVLERSDPSVVLSRMHALLDELSALDLTGLAEDKLLDYARELERARRRIPTLDHALVLEIEGRDLPDKYKQRTAAQLLRELLRIDPHEASARMKAAHAMSARRSFAGEPLPAVFAAVAAAQADGIISERHARTIVETLEKLPDDVTAEHGELIERDLVTYARQFDPHHLNKLAVRISAYYDPDGRLKDVDYRDKHRDLTMTQRPDGSCAGKFEGTAEFAEFLLLLFDAFARPEPEVDGVKDSRTAGQRRHDALLEGMKLSVRARRLPSVAGVTATVVLTMSAEDFERRTGLARTAHGALVPVPEAMRMAGAEYRLMNVVIDNTKGITAYSSTRRLHTEQQRLALIALDGGCTFPNCSAPPGWCEIDHCIDYAAGGPTSVDHAVMACRYHNNDAKKQGWRSTRINGRAAWIPPRWIDPEQEPRYNHLHDPNPPP